VRCILFAVGCSLLFAVPARAESSSGDRAAAEALFNEGRSLMASGKYSEACPKFEASQQLDPGLGTELNLAECYEKVGKSASAWAEYKEAIPMARAAGSKLRQDLAEERARALESRLSTLTIRALGGEDSVALEIRRDGVRVLPAEFGSAIPVDPGPHTVEASAPGKKKWTSTYQVSDAMKVAVDVPQLDAESAPPMGAPPRASTPAPTPPTSQASTQRTAAIVVGAAGVVGLGLATVFGLRAKSNWNDSKAHCTSYPYGCDARGLDLHSSASSQATVSTVSFIAGGAALAVGAVLWFSADTGKTDRVALGFGPGAAFVRGSFQ
jgi:hypothetical protein